MPSLQPTFLPRPAGPPDPGGRLRDLRRDTGLSAKELAARAEWERTKVSKIEHTSRPPSVADIRT
ncbi:MAG TPA: helix-turn-helix transcriptional regulator [Streptosporangiaceae bacterium]|nr:helix-turn-helix transcriptional regulator [Streptosporangiaceae bacterium]